MFNKNKTQSLAHENFNKMMNELKSQGFYTTQLCTTSDYRFHLSTEIYAIVETYWEPKLCPFIMELLYMTDSWCYPWKYDNLIGMLLVDIETQALEQTDEQEAERLFKIKLDLITIMFDQQYLAGHTSAFGLLQDMNLDCRRVKNVAQHLFQKGGSHPLAYFDQIIEPLLKEIIKNGAWSDYFEGFDQGHSLMFSEIECQSVSNKLQINTKLDLVVVHFLIENILCYVYAGDCNSYNPFWIFGSKYYKMLMERIICDCPRYVDRMDEE